MPLPLAHALFGATVVAAVHPKGNSWKPLLIGAAVAVTPDLDLILLWFFHVRGVHRGFSHSIAAAVLVAATALLFVGRSRWKSALAFGAAFLSHGLLDFAAAKAGGGVMLLWPFSHQRFKLGVWGLSELSRGLPLKEVVRASALELVLFLPLLLLILMARFRTRAWPATDRV